MHFGDNPLNDIPSLADSVHLGSGVCDRHASMTVEIPNSAAGPNDEQAEED